MITILISAMLTFGSAVDLDVPTPTDSSQEIIIEDFIEG